MVIAVTNYFHQIVALLLFLFVTAVCYCCLKFSRNSARLFGALWLSQHSDCGKVLTARKSVFASKTGNRFCSLLSGPKFSTVRNPTLQNMTSSTQLVPNVEGLGSLESHLHQ
jgi:hypothetical protein